jgi:hypothetical protein
MTYAGRFIFLSYFSRVIEASSFPMPRCTPGFGGVDAVFLGRCFVGVTTYSLDNFSGNSHIVQVRCQAASESIPAVPLDAFVL